MRIRLGKKTEMILFALVAGVVITAELLDFMLMGGRNESYKRARGRLYGGSAFSNFQNPPKAVFANKQQFYALLNKLKKQGLVEKKISERGIWWKITLAGLQKLKIFKENRKEYEVISDNKLKIIAFDIPEKERRKRDWLREVLKLLGFKMLQRSLWIGKNKISEDFLFDLRKKRMFGYIHIFEINKTGTIKELL